MKIQFLPSTIDNDHRASQRQHLSCFVVDDLVAVDAGSLAFSVNDIQRQNIRNIVLTHAHLDHIAGLPLFIDDLFAITETPINIHATTDVIDVLERDIFNWSVYPRFSELSNDHGPVLKYSVIEPDSEFNIEHLTFREVAVSHKVPDSGFMISDDRSALAFTGDTAETDKFWDVVNELPNLAVLLVECAFPNELSGLAEISHHMTPDLLDKELRKLKFKNVPIYAVNLKPMYREKIIKQLEQLELKNLEVLEIGKVYEF